MNLHRALILVVLLSLTGCNPAPEQTFPSPTESVESNFVNLTLRDKGRTLKQQINLEINLEI